MLLVNTHVHADHITGSGKLKQELTGATSALGIDSGAKADFYLDQGQKLQIGEIELEARKTPGHTDGMSCLRACFAVVVKFLKVLFSLNV